MIKANFKTYNSYVTDSLYQWERNQKLEISGLNLVVAPEIHFSNAEMDKAIVRQSVLTDRIVTVDIPNSMLQSSSDINVYIGIYDGETFKVIETVCIPIKPRKKPEDYILEVDDHEVYSFKALENKLNNLIAHNADTGSNSELLDIRVGSDGKIYHTAGEAVREQYESLGQKIEELNRGGLEMKDDIIGKNVENWLNTHPEATTSVQDGSISMKKIKLDALGYVTPELFGAKGDGVHDDTTAFQMAIDLGCTNILLSKNKTYSVSTIKIFNKSFCLIGDGTSTIKSRYTEAQQNSFTSIIETLDGKKNPTQRKFAIIKGVVFNGNSLNININKPCGSTANMGARLIYYDFVNVENCVFKNTVMDGLYIGACKNVFVKNNKFETIGLNVVGTKNAITVLDKVYMPASQMSFSRDSDLVVISKNTFDDIMDEIIRIDNIINFDFSDNVVKKGGQYLLEIFYSDIKHDWKINVSNNVIDGLGSTIFNFDLQNSGKIPNSGLVSCNNNNFKNIGKMTDRHISELYQHEKIITLFCSEYSDIDIICENNIFHMNKETKDNNNTIFQVKNINRLILKNNKFELSDKHKTLIPFSVACKDCSIVYNYIDNKLDNMTTFLLGSDMITFKNNNIENAFYSIIRISENAKKLIFTGNHIENSKNKNSKFIELYGENLILENCIISNNVLKMLYVITHGNFRNSTVERAIVSNNILCRYGDTNNPVVNPDNTITSLVDQNNIKYGIIS